MKKMNAGELSLGEAAQRLEATYHTVRNWLAAGRYGLEGGVRGGHWFVTAASVARAQPLLRQARPRAA